MQGYKGFWVDYQRIIDGIHIGEYARREPHVIVSVMGIFKGEDGERIHLLPLINVTQSGIKIQGWLVRLVDLLKIEERNNFPEFCNEEGYILSASSIESVFHPILEEIQDNRDRILADAIPSELVFKEHYQCNHSFCRGA